MDGYVMSRSRTRSRDYAFLGAAPPRQWWRSYADVADFEYPTLLVESDAQGWRAYLSGIHSVRTDAVGTTVRFTLVLSGGPADEAAPRVARLAARWLEDIAEGTPGGAVGSCLDRHFSGEDVDRLLGARDPGAAAETLRRLHQALEDVTEPPSGERTGGDAEADLEDGAVVPPSWFDAMDNRSSRGRFALWVDELLSGTTGRALLLNLAAEPADAAEIGPKEEPVAVLTAHPKATFHGGPVAIPGKSRGLVDAGPARTTRRRFFHGKSTGKKVLIAAGGLVVLGGIAAVVWRLL
ncbi:hypothetical protein VR41_03250 [Streptomyces sp. NRRL B-1568]|nr:hypothetical protein VR41_03250 [Streptomyces sp. NRRL B-1568]